MSVEGKKIYGELEELFKILDPANARDNDVREFLLAGGDIARRITDTGDRIVRSKDRFGFSPLPGGDTLFWVGRDGRMSYSNIDFDVLTKAEISDPTSSYHAFARRIAQWRDS